MTTIEITQGCTTDDIKIDGVSFTNMTTPELDLLVDDLAQKIKEYFAKNEIALSDIVEIFPVSEFKNTGPECDHCHDTPTSAIYNII